MKQVRTSDVIIFTDGDCRTASLETWELRPPVRERFNLTDDLWIGPLDSKESGIVLKACEAPGYEFNASRPYNELYSFIRDNPPRGNSQGWDEDGRLQRCVALSRLVHATSVAFDYSARIVRTEDGDVKTVFPGAVSGPGSAAYVADRSSNWLTLEDCVRLKKLVEAYDKSPLDDHASNALWHHEFAARTHEINVGWVLVTTGLECLIHTSAQYKYRSMRQFKVRVPLLADRVRFTPITEEEAKEMYEVRCTLTHGNTFYNIPPQTLQMYEKMERLLAVAIQEAILDASFAAFLTDRERIDQEWPM